MYIYILDMGWVLFLIVDKNGSFTYDLHCQAFGGMRAMLSENSVSWVMGDFLKLNQWSYIYSIPIIVTYTYEYIMPLFGGEG